MTAVYWAAYVMLGGGALLTLVRLARGPSLLDRVIATDVLLVIISAGLAVYAGAVWALRIPEARQVGRLIRGRAR